MTNSVRRSMAVLALGAALATTGCGVTSADRAATVDGTVITETEVQQATRELNALQPALFEKALSTGETLSLLVQARSLNEMLVRKSAVSSDSVARAETARRGLKEPGSGALEIVRLYTAIQAAGEAGKLTNEDFGVALAETGKRDVTVNPRYGTFDPTTSTIQLVQPSWITSTDAPQ